MGEARGEGLRKQFRRDAYASFPAERLLVVEKPSSRIPIEEAQSLLTNRLMQIAMVYEEVGRLRYVFRPIEVARLERVSAPKGKKVKRNFIETTALHWQIRFNCGEIRTLPDMAGFRTLHFLLSKDHNQSVTPEEALANEPKTENNRMEASIPGADPLSAYFGAQGIVWNDLSLDEQKKLIRAAPSLKIRRYTELRELQDDADLSPSEGNELDVIKKELGALADAAENVYLSMKTSADEKLTNAEMCETGLHIEGGNYDRLGSDRRGLDSPAAQLFRARMKRVKDCLRENGFADFARHIEDVVQSTGAKWSYNPPDNVEWTTS